MKKIVLYQTHLTDGPSIRGRWIGPKSLVNFATALWKKKCLKKWKRNLRQIREQDVPLFYDFNESQEQQWMYEIKNLFLATLSLSVYTCKHAMISSQWKKFLQWKFIAMKREIHRI